MTLSPYDFERISKSIEDIYKGLTCIFGYNPAHGEYEIFIKHWSGLVRKTIVPEYYGDDIGTFYSNIQSIIQDLSDDLMKGPKPSNVFIDHRGCSIPEGINVVQKEVQEMLPIEGIDDFGVF